MLVFPERGRYPCRQTYILAPPTGYLLKKKVSFFFTSTSTMPQLLLGFCFLWLGTLSGQIPNPFFPQLGQGIGVNALAAKGDTLFVAGDFQVLGTTNR